MSRKQETSVKNALQECVHSCGAVNAMLITREGVNIAEAGDTSFLNATAMAALVAGMFSATREVARMVGEKQFSILLQQGENRHIHISLVTDKAMMVVVFEDFQRTGRVRHEAKKTGEALAQRLASSQDSKRVGAELPMPEFKEYALNLIDRIFEAK
jgi:predicted regulator of Ras-like GTPase activity (Roadblock/LC7/MglB family)